MEQSVVEAHPKPVVEFVHLIGPLTDLDPDLLAADVRASFRRLR